VYILPIWSISLEAPQYPEGIGMHIWVDKITGKNPHDLQNINGLNHYIGMKAITPETITELKVMPWIFGLLIGLGLVAAATGKPVMLCIWVGLFLACSILGLVDFYLWEYDYGHDLDPTAAIKVPGMNYQPPLIGSKKLLNFTAHSWPALGGWIIFASLITGMIMMISQIRAFLSARRQQGSTDSAPGHRSLSMVIIGFIFVAVAGCTLEPKPLAYGLDQCNYCRMTLSDEQYGGSWITSKGKIYTFDSVECLAAHLATSDLKSTDIHSLWVVDYEDPSQLISVDEAFFLHSRDLPSPMGMNLTAFGTGITRQAVQHSFYGEILDWQGVDSLVRVKMLADSSVSMRWIEAIQP
jgi:copper chaperone NosL